MVWHRVTTEEQDRARTVNLEAFLMDYDFERFDILERGYLVDKKTGIVINCKKSWWYDNSPGSLHKNGNAIDFLVYVEGYNFTDAVMKLLAFEDMCDKKEQKTRLTIEEIEPEAIEYTMGTAITELKNIIAMHNDSRETLTEIRHQAAGTFLEWCDVWHAANKYAEVLEEVLKKVEEKEERCYGL